MTEGLDEAGLPPLVPPGLAFAYEALVEIGPTRSLGEGPLGERRIVPILGGRFAGPGLGGVGLQGRVLPGGADRQLLRRDGIKELDALYEMETTDGAVLTVRNRVLIDAPPGAARQARSALRITAPEGPHGWLNRTILVGTLDPLMPARHAVLVRVFRVL